MQVQQLQFDVTNGWEPGNGPAGRAPDLILAFAGTETLEGDGFYRNLLERYEASTVVFVSAADFIAGSEVHEVGGVATMIWFDGTAVSSAVESVDQADDSERAGKTLGLSLYTEELRHVLLFSEGLNINGTALLRGLSECLGPGVSVTGGLASDGERFGRTLVGLNERPTANRVVAIGFAGSRIEIGVGSLGGWIPFGHEMSVTRSDGNVVYELDDEPALEVYQRLLGARAYALPASGLLFPLSIESPEGDDALVRTLLAVDQDKKSVTFAGDVPEGFRAKVMQADLDQLISASGSAASASSQQLKDPALAILISCIGRKLLLQLRTHEEVAAARQILGSRTTFAGFYSYGEISPASDHVECRLQNQTMTITTMSEKP